MGVLRTLLRSGMLRPTLPAPESWRLLFHAPYLGVDLSTAVAIHAAREPRANALRDDAGPLTWAEMDRRVSRLANALLEGASPGDRIAFLMRNGRELVEAYAATSRAGMVAVALNTWSSPEDLRAVMEVHDPALLLHDPDFDRLLEEAGWTGSVTTGPAYEALLAASQPHHPHVRPSGRIITQTSGTTGRPKGAERAVSAGAARQLLDFLERVPLRRSDRILVAPPLFHAFAQGMLGIAMTLGAQVVVQPRFDAAATSALLHRADVTVAALVPVMLQRLLDALDGSPPRLRAVVVSGSALTPALRARAEKAFGPVVYDLYGATEVGFATIADSRDARRKPGTAGRAGAGTRIMIAAEDGTVAGPGEVGEIRVDTGLAFEGYTGEAARDGTVRTGDLGRLDEDGYLFVAGRADDMVISGGENVHPSEVEAALEGHPAVAECAVVGVDDAEYGQVLVAYVVPRGDVDPARLTEFLRGRLARYKVPKRILLTAALPRTATGKVRKSQLGE